jgi:ribokinase
VVGAAVTGRVVVVGDIATDVVARLSGPLQGGSDTGAAVTMYGGGSAGNVAAWLAFVGVPVTVVGRVGADAAGRTRVDELALAGVDVQAAVDRDRPTGCVVVLVDPDGERTMVPDRGASAALSPADVPAALFDGPPAHLHLSGYPVLHAQSREGALAALDRARVAGWTISVDASSTAPLRTAGASRFVEWTQEAGLCFANADEASVLAGPGAPAEHARHLAASAYGEAVVKLGAAGALWSDGAAVVEIPARPVRATDTTGAGDAFAAGFLSIWTRGGPPAAALDAGAGLAAIAVTQDGARPHAAGRRAG